MIAHVRKCDGGQQTLPAHLAQVTVLCALAARSLGLETMARLLGLLHDMGKATEKFKHYLLSSLDKGPPLASPHPHALTGAIFVYRRWFCQPGAKSIQRLAAQILALCIQGHHAGLTDCLNVRGESAFLEAMEQAEEPLYYREAVSWFCENVASEAELDELFRVACEEIETFFYKRIRQSPQLDGGAFDTGMLARLLLSILVDADRWDSACFERGRDALAQTPGPDWNRLLNTFEAFRQKNLNGQGEIDRIRAEISDACFTRATSPPGIYELCVPTGGGKTYSSLRFALRHAAQYGKDRIFSIIPFNTILDQNAKDIRDALSDYPSILEHHCNVIQETEEEQKAYRLLTERWDSDIILTSLVQFLNACFTASNTNARRMYHLTNAVLIFDEIQALPKHCKTLFERAISFLTHCCGTTVILCTATQPKLDLTPKAGKLVKNQAVLFQRMKRVCYLPQSKPPCSDEAAAARIVHLLETQSVLTIVNTKRVALDVYEKTISLLKEMGESIVFADISCTEEEILQMARQSGPRDILCVHLSTLLCPAHRKKLIAWSKLWLREGARVLCVSTALIEAGINISFPIVVRSLAGLPSIVQAAGRANRSMEYAVGTVYLWDFAEENLQNLPDIRNGDMCTREMLAISDPSDLDAPTQIETYFAKESALTKESWDGPFDKKDKRLTLYSFLSSNSVCKAAGRNFKGNEKLILHQSFRTANQAFSVIPEETVSVLVPFGEGKQLIAQLCSEHTMEEEIFLLQKAQAYSVSLYRSTYQSFAREGAIEPVGQTGALSLQEGYYDPEKGVILERAAMDLLLC